MRSKKRPSKKERTSTPMPLLATLVYPVQWIAFIAIMALFYWQGPSLYLVGIAIVGCIPSFILMATRKDFLLTDTKGRRIYHKSLAYLFTSFIVFAYLWLLMRSNEFGPITKFIAIPAICLIYYSIYSNLEGRGRRVN